MIRFILGLLLGILFFYTANKVSGIDGVWWLLVGVIIGGLASAIDRKFNHP